MKLEIVKYPAEVLRRIAAPVESFDDNLLQLAFQLEATLDQTVGRGLAAPQIGRSVRMVLIREPGYPQFYMVNPKIISEKGSIIENEGCLSIPGFRGRVIRSSSLVVKYQNLTGNPQSRRCKGALAIVVQHEIDHLHGILFVDQLVPADKLRWELLQRVFVPVPVLHSAQSEVEPC